MMSENEWKSDLAIMLPMALLALAAVVGAPVSMYMNGKVEIERLRLAQMQYSAEWNVPKPEARDE